MDRVASRRRPGGPRRGGRPVNDPVERILQALENAGCSPKPAGEGKWVSFCPSHEADGYRHRPSLSIAPGADGKVLLKCHAGCPVGRICDALDLRQADLFDDDGRPRPGGERPKPNGKPKPGGEKPKDGAGCGEGPTDGRVFKTAREAVTELSRRFGRPRTRSGFTTTPRVSR